MTDTSGESTVRLFERLTSAMESLSEIDSQRAREIEELRRGMAALAEVMATHADVDDLRAEMLSRIAEATATPFNPPPDHA